MYIYLYIYIHLWYLYFFLFVLFVFFDLENTSSYCNDGLHLKSKNTFCIKNIVGKNILFPSLFYKLFDMI